MRTVNWGGAGFPAYAGYLWGDDDKPKSGVDKTAEDQRARDEKARTDRLKTTDPFLNSFLGPDYQHTPFYKTLYNTGVESTNAAYDNAESAQKLKANAAGFDNTQPIEQAADTGLEGQRATALARVPFLATEPAVDAGFKAAGLRTNQAGLFNPTSDLAIASSHDLGQQQLDQANNAGLWAALTRLGTNAEDNIDWSFFG